MPLYSGGRPDQSITTFHSWQDGAIVVVAYTNGVIELWVDGTPVLTPEDCADIGAALTALGQP